MQADGAATDRAGAYHPIHAFLRDGDVVAAIDAHRVAIGAAGPAPSRRLAVAHTGLGLALVCAGDIAAANRALSAAHDVFEELDPPAPAWLLAHAGIGAIAALRGEEEVAEAELDRAVAMARALGDAHLEAIVRTLRAEVTATSHPRRAHVDARFAARTLAPNPTPGTTASAASPGFPVWAERARAIAAVASGEHRAAALIAQRLLAQPLNPLDRGRTRLVQARAAIALGDEVLASSALQDAVDRLTAAGANWFLVDALLLLAEAEPDRAEAHLRRARDLTTPDPAHARRWARRPTLTLQVLGTQRLLIAGEPLTFRSTKTQRLLFCLALAGPRGREVDALAALLWPDASDASSNITTATWDARRGLGVESWRLRREGTRLALDVDGAHLDLEDLTALAAAPPPPSASPAQQLAWREAVGHLHRPVLPAWAYEEWVIEADLRRASVAASLPSASCAPANRASGGSDAAG